MPHSPQSSCLCNGPLETSTGEICPTHPDELTGGSGKPEARQGPGKNAEAKAPVLLLPLSSRTWRNLPILRFFSPHSYTSIIFLMPPNGHSEQE